MADNTDRLRRIEKTISELEADGRPARLRRIALGSSQRAGFTEIFHTTGQEKTPPARAGCFRLIGIDIEFAHLSGPHPPTTVR